MTNDEDSKDMALFERTLKGAAQAAGILSKSVWSTIADRGANGPEAPRGLSSRAPPRMALLGFGASPARLRTA